MLWGLEYVLWLGFEEYKSILNFLELTVYLQFQGVFFMDPDPDFLPIQIRIRTQERKFDPDPDKRTRIRNTDVRSREQNISFLLSIRDAVLAGSNR